MNETAAEAHKPVSVEDKQRGAKAFRWFHTLDLGDGVVTEGMKPARRLAFQADHVFRHPLDGQSVLDIGCWDGFFAFEARRRGAGEVLGVDHHVWTRGWGKKEAFALARRCIDPAVGMKDIPFEEMTPDNSGLHDVVLYLGMLHHMRDPLGAIARAAALTRRMLVVETHIDPRLPPEPPALAFYPFKELNNDPGTWFGPNPAGVIALLRACGFERVEHDTDYSANNPANGLFHAFR